jgi:hypothetical protein
VLFSKESVAKFIDTHFEPVWQSVRPVPIVQINFGDGRVLTRTLHGNILTAVCDADGRVLDALPGIYTEKTYLDRLNQLQLLARYVKSKPAAKQSEVLRSYHERQAEAIRKQEPPQVFAMRRKQVPITKRVIENPMEVMLVAAQPGKATPAEPKDADAKLPKDELANWKLLEEDTRLNETTRRLQIHELLARTGPASPDKVTRPIYKDVLHADLDDPYLGLGKVLSETYPWKD